ncbi:MAG: segregation and condensation protein A [Burkholderiales bacterium]
MLEPVIDHKISEPVGMFRGEEIFHVPENLYIPPEALRIMLESFQGPLDLLLFLIRKQNLDVLDIPMAELTRQYMVYVDEMRKQNLELAAEYLLMAAVLAEIKSRMLLPRVAVEDDEEVDPRAELVRRLIEYERMKEAAAQLEVLPQLGRDFSKAHVFFEKTQEVVMPGVSVDDLRNAWISILNRAKNNQHHKISRDELSVREHMSLVLRKLKDQRFIRFEDLFDIEKGVQYLVVSFLALLELAKESSVTLSQQGVLSTIYVRLSDGIIASGN